MLYIPEAMRTAATRGHTTAQWPESESHAASDPKAAEFKADLLFMIALPTAVLSFLAFCAVMIALSP